MSAKETRDMTEGSPFRLILVFFIPMLGGLLFQQLYNMADMVIVGQCLGVTALAAVGATGSVNFMILGFCQGVCNGFAIPVAQKFGERNERSMRKYVANSGWLAGAFSILVTVIVCIFCRRILMWMNTPDDIIEGAYSYIFVIFLGIPATVLYNMLSGIIRSLGDSTTPLVFLIFSSVLNVALDFLFILALDMGVGGAGWATVTAQAVSGILCLLYMRKKFTILKMDQEERKPDTSYMKNLCIMGIPMGLQYSITAIGSVVLQTAVNGLGSMAVAATAAGTKISGFFCCPYDALGATMATYGGQNVGARRLDRVDQGLKTAAVIGCLYSIAAFVILWFFGRRIAEMFVNSEERQIIEDTFLFLVINAAFYIPLVFVNVVRFMIQGLGYSGLAVLAGVCEMAARTFVGFALVPVWGYTAACFASPAAWIAADIFLLPAYRYVLKKLGDLFGEKVRQHG